MDVCCNREEICHLNRPITRNEIEYVIKTLPTNKSRTRWPHKRIQPNIQRRTYTHPSFFFFFLSFLGPHPRHMEVPRLGVGLIGAVAAGLSQSHSNAGSKLCLQPTPQLTATPDP